MTYTYETSGQAETDQAQRWSDMNRFALTLDPTITDDERAEWGTFQPISDEKYECMQALFNAADEARRKRWKGVC